MTLDEKNALLSRISTLKNQSIAWIGQLNSIGPQYIEGRNEILDYAEHIINDSADLLDNIYTQITEAINIYQEHFNTLNNQLQQQNIQIPNIMSMLTSWVDQLPNQKKAYKYNWAIQEIQNKIGTLEENTRDNRFQEKIQNDIKEIERLKQEIRNIHQTIVDEAAIASRHEQVNSLELRANQHQSQENHWGYGLIACVILLLLTLGSYWIIKIPKNGNNIDIPDAIHIALGYTLCLSTLGIAIKIFLGRYLAERSLKVMYLHRISVIEQYPNLETGLSTDTELKNNMRLELAKFVFSDPGISAIKETQIGDININPLLSIAEKAANKISK